jgi:hypothetical protein
MHKCNDIGFDPERSCHAAFTAFYTPNVVHPFSRMETISAARKRQPFVYFDEN